MRSHGVTNFPDPSAGRSFSINGSGSGINPDTPTFKAASKACQKYERSGTITPSQRSQAEAQALKYAQCMRKHGVTNFPDPSANGGPQSISQYGINPDTPTFKAANQACQSLLSGGSGS